MANKAEELFNQMTYRELIRLVSDGEPEGQFLETKSPSSSKLSKPQRGDLAKMLSGFSNGGGGIVIYGVSTIKKSHGNIDILSQIEPIGDCKGLLNQLVKYVPLSTTPTIKDFKTKTLKRRGNDTKGVVVLYIPPVFGDPIRSDKDYKFYLRLGDQFGDLPYELIKRMFIGVESPDIVPFFPIPTIKKHTVNKKDWWGIKIGVRNETSMVAENLEVLFRINDIERCEILRSEKDFRDISSLNPGTLSYMFALQKPLHKGLDIVAGDIFLRMKGRNRILKVYVNVYANKMRAKKCEFKLEILKDKFKVADFKSDYLY